LIISSKFENIYIGIPSLERDVDIYTCRSRFVAIVVAFGFGFALASALCPLPSAAVPFPSYPIDMAVAPTNRGKEPAGFPSASLHCLSLWCWQAGTLIFCGARAECQSNKFILIHKINTLLASTHASQPLQPATLSLSQSLIQSLSHSVSHFDTCHL